MYNFTFFYLPTIYICFPLAACLSSYISMFYGFVIYMYMYRSIYNLFSVKILHNKKRLVFVYGRETCCSFVAGSSKHRDCKLSTIKGCFNLYLSSVLCKTFVWSEIKFSNFSSLEFRLNVVERSETQ